MKLRYLAFVGIIFFWTCSKDDQINTNNEPNIIVDKNVVVLKTPDVVERQDSNILFLRKTAITDTLEIGDIIVSGTTEKLKSGFLGKITSIKLENGSIQLTTTPASLTEVFKECSFKEKRFLSPSDTLRSTNFEISFEQILYDEDNNESTKNDQVKLKGDISTTLNFLFELEIEDYNLKYFKSGFESLDELNIELKTELSYAKFKNETALKSWNFTPINIQVGVVPIVIFPALVIRVGWDGEIKAEVLLSTKRTSGQNVNVEFKNGSWSNNRNGNETYNLLNSNIKGEIESELYLKSGIEFYLYNLKDIKSSITLKPYIKGNAVCNTTDFNCSSTIKGGASLEANVKIEMFDKKLIDYTNTFIDIEKVFYNSSFQATSGFFTDSRDGQKYKWVKIGNQIWMAENLRFQTTNSMSSISGQLYDYLEMLNVCPSGYHLANIDELRTLINFVGGQSIAGSKLKSKSFGGTDDFGFNILPSVYYFHNGPFGWKLEDFDDYHLLSSTHTKNTGPTSGNYPIKDISQLWFGRNVTNCEDFTHIIHVNSTKENYSKLTCRCLKD